MPTINKLSNIDLIVDTMNISKRVKMGDDTVTYLRLSMRAEIFARGIGGTYNKIVRILKFSENDKMLRKK